MPPPKNSLPKRCVFQLEAAQIPPQPAQGNRACWIGRLERRLHKPNPRTGRFGKIQRQAIVQFAANTWPCAAFRRSRLRRANLRLARAVTASRTPCCGAPKVDLPSAHPTGPSPVSVQLNRRCVACKASEPLRTPPQGQVRPKRREASHRGILGQNYAARSGVHVSNDARFRDIAITQLVDPRILFPTHAVRRHRVSDGVGQRPASPESAAVTSLASAGFDR